MYKMKSIRICYVLLILFIGCVDLSEDENRNNNTLPIQTSFKVEDFSSAEECAVCHPQYYAEWSSSMHAYSIVDPVWLKQQNMQQAHSAAEGIEIGDFCVQCHSPVAGLTNLIKDHMNLTSDIINALPPQAKEGVTCDACHLTTNLPSPTNISITNHDYETIDFKLFSSDTRYGILDNPVDNDFHKSVYNSDYDKSEFCQNCHNLTVDNRDAEITQFEWEQSSFQAMGVECQTCHMPLYSGKAAISGQGVDLFLKKIQHCQRKRMLPIRVAYKGIN